MARSKFNRRTRNRSIKLHKSKRFHNLSRKKKSYLKGGKKLRKKNRKLKGGALFDEAGAKKKLLSLNKSNEDIKIDDSLLGEGSFGDVKLGTLTGYSDKVAIKTLKLSGISSDDFIKEAEIMAGLEHDNIVKLLAISDLNNRTESLKICLEYCNGISLESMLLNTPSIAVNTLLNYMISVADAMIYISNMGIVHRDLAARNILLCRCTEDFNKKIDYASCTAKIADFGLSRIMKVQDGSMKYIAEFSEILGDSTRTAPEVMSEGTFTTSTDIWAFGVTLWETMTFCRECGYEYEKFKTHYVTHMLNKPTLFDVTEITSLIEKCWKIVPSERLPFIVIKTQLEKLNTEDKGTLSYTGADSGPCVANYI